MGRPRRTDLAVVPDLDRELEMLYGLPLAEFTAARNELAKRLKKAGQTREGESVGSLAKPSISAWAVNQLARRHADRVRELLEAGAQLVDAQKAALAGKGAVSFDEAGRRQRDAVRSLTAAATAALDDAGHRPSDAVRERIASSLRAASVDPEGRDLLERGRLTEDFESAGLDLLAGLAPTRRKRGAVAKDSEREARLREAREQLETAREEHDRLVAEAAEAERAAAEARAAAEEATERASTLADEAGKAASAVEQAEEALERLERD